MDAETIKLLREQIDINADAITKIFAVLFEITQRLDRLEATAYPPVKPPPDKEMWEKSNHLR